MIAPRHTTESTLSHYPAFLRRRRRPFVCFSDCAGVSSILHFLLLLTLTFVLSLLAPSRTAAANTQADPTIEAVQIGFADQFKLGRLTPLALEIKGGERKTSCVVTVQLRDGDGLWSQFTSSPDEPIELAPGAATRVELLVQFGRPAGEILVRLHEAGKLHEADKVIAKRAFSYGGDSAGAQPPRSLPADDRLLLLLGPEIGLADMLSQSQRNQVRGPQTHLARLSDPRRLPSKWFAYQGVDTLLLATSDSQLWRRLLEDPVRAAALRNWVFQGGRLVLFVGRQAPLVLADDSPLAPLLPGRFAGFQALRETRGLEVYCDSQFPLSVEGANSLFEAPQLSDLQGHIEVSARGAAGSVPLVVRHTVGFGQVVYTAFDPDQAPISDWPGRPDLLRRLLGYDSPGAVQTAPRSDRRFGARGYHDLTGQLRAALDEFPSVRVVPFWLVVSLIVIYIGLIGPGDYFFLKRVIHRMQWTWLTFPLLVLAAGALAVFLANRWKGNSLEVNQVELVDVDLESGQVRGSLWLNVYSPRAASLDLSLEPRSLCGAMPSPASARLAWLGVPGRGLGGMQSQADQPGPMRPYRFSAALDRLEEVPLATWSAKALTADWNGRGECPLSAELSEDLDDMLIGVIRNDSDADLTDCRLLYDRWVYRFPALPAGGQRRIDRSLHPRGFRGLVTAEPYDQSSTDVATILDRIMFYDAVGGESHTRLGGAYLAHLDMSGRLSQGRAILLARVPDNDPSHQKTRSSLERNNESPRCGSRLLLSGDLLPESQVYRQTFYRFVFPVSPRE